MDRLAKIATALTTTAAYSAKTGDIEAVIAFIKTVRQHFPTPKKSEDEDRDWVRSMAYILRDYVASELAFAAETILKTRETRGFPLPAECLRACAHARTVIRVRTTVTQPVLQKDSPEPGMLIWKRRDAEWREKRKQKALRDA
jgi:hypothetical protein